MSLVANGTADYQGGATFAANSTGDTITLTGTATSFGFAPGDTIVVSGAGHSAMTMPLP